MVVVPKEGSKLPWGSDFEACMTTPNLGGSFDVSPSAKVATIWEVFFPGLGPLCSDCI